MKRTVQKSITKVATKPTAPKSTAKVVVAKPDVTAAKVDRVVHTVSVDFAGTSSPLNSGRSRTPLRVDEFGQAPDLVLTDHRDLTILSPLYGKYKTNEFARGNCDTGILNRAIRKGVLKYVGGGVNSENARLQFVQNPRASA